eukprot:5319611-Pyramimonas_sp.AAC.1
MEGHRSDASARSCSAGCWYQMRSESLTAPCRENKWSEHCAAARHMEPTRMRRRHAGTTSGKLVSRASAAAWSERRCR